MRQSLTARLAATLGRSDVLSVGLVCLVLRAVSLFRTCLSDDEAIYAVVAREMLAGRGLYRDVVDHKPPLIYVVYAFTQAVGGPSGGMVLLHLLTIVAVFATALLLRRVVIEWAGPAGDSGAPRAAALLYAVFTTTMLPFDGLAANCELFMMLPLAASVLYFLRGCKDLRLLPLLLSGVLLGIAFFCKYQAGVQLALYAAGLILFQWRRLPRATLAGLALGTGFAGVVAAALALMRAAGCLDDAWFWFRFNFGYIKTGFTLADTLRRAAVRISFVAGAAAFLWILGTRAALGSLWAKSDDADVRFTRFVALWALASGLAVTTGGRFFGHYFHQITAPLAVLAAPAAARLLRTRRLLALTAVAGPASAFFLLAIFQGPAFALAGQRSPDLPALAAAVGANAGPRESLVVWGNLPVLYFVAERPLGTRFVFSNYMTGLSPATPSQSDPSVDASANIVPESWTMFEADVAARKPRLLVDTSPGDLGAYGKFPPSKFPRLQALLQRDYRAIAETAGARIFVRREGID